MERKRFLQSLAVIPLIGAAMKLNSLNKMAEAFDETEKMPVLFLGHGSPMNAIEENEFVEGFRKIGKTIPKPNAILCVSAHWETKGTFVTARPVKHDLVELHGFFDALVARGIHPEMRLIEFSLLIAFAHLRQIMGRFVHAESIGGFHSHLK